MAKKPLKLVFLDRDGVINEFPGNGRYVTKVSDFHFIPGSLEAIRILTEEGFTIFVVSNQAGVGKGIFTEKKLQQINNKMLNGIKKAGGKVKKVFYATARSDENSPMRKPNIGSVRAAVKMMGTTMAAVKNAYFVGDTEVDIQAGKNAGMKTIFVLSGREDCVYMR
ncbi:MAG: HAD-IIIA family hydrolase, partial [Candidatus Omnitrophica bacterium]|nr:HAD-IIIA family hydrolase [Candidatus Omnitrophota bacterium]